MVFFETFMQYKRIARFLKAFNPTMYTRQMSHIAKTANKCVWEGAYGTLDVEKFYNMLVAGGLLRCLCLYEQNFSTYLVKCKGVGFYCHITSKQYAQRLLELYTRRHS